MNNRLSPVTAVLVVVALGGFLFAVFHFNQQALGVDRLTLMAPHPDGRVGVKLGNRLYWLRSDVSSHGTVGDDPVPPLDLAELGIRHTVGGFGFLASGELLIASDSYDPGAGEALAVYQRQQNHDYTRPDASNSSANQLLRCDPDTRRCRPFSRQLPAFTRSFRLAVDWGRERVYVADTSRHRLVMLDLEGRQLAVAEGFRFPNQLRLIDGGLWLADTNHHRLVRVGTDDDSFGEIVEERSVGLGRYTWPSDLAAIGDQTWVLLMNSDMARGRIARYNSDWQLLGTLNLPAGADVMALIGAGDSVLVSDYGRFALYAYGDEGARLTDRTLPALTEHLAAARGEYRHNRLIVLGLWAVFAVVVFAGLRRAVAAIPERFEPVSVNGDPAVAADSLPALPAEGLWLKPHIALRVAVPALAVALLGAGLVAVMMLLLSPTSGRVPLVALTLFLLAVAVLPISALRKLLRWRLGLFPDQVILVDGDGFHHRCCYRELVWHESACRIGARVLALPQGLRTGLFPAQPLRRHLVPRLAGDRHINQWLMFKYQLQAAGRPLRLAVVAGWGVAGLILALQVWTLYH